MILLPKYTAALTSWLILDAPRHPSVRHARGGPDARDLLWGAAAGLGFGVQVSALGMVTPAAGLTPLAISQFVSVGTIAASATAQSLPWLSRDRYSALASVAGLMAGIATVYFHLAVQRGLLTIAGVLASLYPAATVTLAAFTLRERIYRMQGAGLVLAALAVALIASG